MRDDDSVFASLQQVTGATYTNASYNRDLIDVYLLGKARDKGIRLPTGGPPNEYKYLGAWVETSKAGMNHNVVYIDVGSMYPSQLMSMNASPETIIGTEGDLADSQYTVDDCVWGYIDPRPVKHLSKGEPWRQYTDGEYKMIYDPHAPAVKWTCDEGDGPQYTKLYFLDHDTEKGFLTECVEELISLKNQYRGTSLYGSTKRVTNCFTPDTEVMTPDGVVKIRDLDVGDRVYSFNTDSEEVEIKPVTKTWEYPDYHNDVLNFQRGRLDLSVTPNHNMVVKKDNPSPNSSTWDEYKFVEAGDLEPYSHYELPHHWDVDHGDELDTVDITDWLDDYEVWFNNADTHGHTVRSNVDGELKRRQIGGCDNRRNGYTVSNRVFEENREYIEDIASEIYAHAESKHKWVPKDYDGDDFLRFLAWYITEGSSRVNGGDKEKYETKRGKTWQITFSQKTEPGRSLIADLFERMGIEPHEDYQGYSFSSKSLYTILRDLCGTDSFDKQIPEFVYGLSKRQKQLFFDTLIEGDGDSRETSYRYTTSSTQLRDDVMRLCVHLGRNPRYCKDSGSWRILYSEGKNQIRPNRIVEEDTADDGVYCVSVKDNHTLLAGRNGKFQFVGQSIYGVLGFANKDSSFRLFDWRIAEAITLCGRKMIQYSRDYVLEYLQDRGYEAYSALGDTDGVGIALPAVSTRHEALDVVEDAVEQLNGEGYDQFFKNEMGVEPQHHHGEIEVESYAPRVFIPSRNPPHGEIGVKKRRIEWQTWDEDDGEIDDISITGLEAERSDVAPITKEAQRLFAETLRMDETDAREWLFPKLRELYNDIDSGSIALDRVCKRGGLGQSLDEYGTANRRAGPLYRGAKYANDQLDGVTIQRGDKPAVVYLRDVPDEYPSTYDTHTAEDGDRVDAVSLIDPTRLPDGFEINHGKHLRKALIEPMEPLLETRFGGEAWSQVIHQHSQQGLQAFE